MSLHKFLYLFLVDLVRLPYGHDYDSYINSEPGYAGAQLRAYLSAFNDSHDGKISHQLLKKINREAMAFDKTVRGGEYKNNCNHYDIAPMDMNDLTRSIFACIPTYSADIKGLEEFLSYWLLNDAESIHSISFGWRNEGDNIPQYAITKSLKGKEALNWVKGEAEVKTEYSLNFESSIKQIALLFNNFAYQISIDSGFNIDDGHATPIVNKKMEKIINEFDSDIRVAISDDDKITCIVKHVQHIAQLHPFADGNIRTCYILLNKLLRDYGLPLTILLNPNRLDCCSVSTIVEMVKLGQTYYLQLLNCTDQNLIFNTNESIDKLKAIVCTPQLLVDIKDEQLLSDFSNYVVRGMPLIQASVADNPHHMFFDKISVEARELALKLRGIINNDPKFILIQEAFDEGKFGLGFRRACALGTYEIVESILLFKDKISLDVNEASSNGNTGMDWLAQNKNCSADDKPLINALLFASGCRKKAELSLV